MPKNLSAALLALAMLMSGCLPARPSAALVLQSGLQRSASARAHADTKRSQSGLQVSFKEAFYDVAGLTARDLNIELGRRGPNHEGVPWQGETTFQVSYSYRPSWAVDGGCRAVKPQVSVRLITKLPHWTNRADAPQPLQSDWDVYFERLSRHEEGHRRIAIDAGNELLEDVGALREDGCDALHEKVVAVARSFEEKVALQQQDWDDQTSHGIAVGA